MTYLVTYIMFFDVSYSFFCAELKSDECQLKKFENFYRFKVKGQTQGQIFVASQTNTRQMRQNQCNLD